VVDERLVGRAREEESHVDATERRGPQRRGKGQVRDEVRRREPGALPCKRECREVDRLDCVGAPVVWTAREDLDTLVTGRYGGGKVPWLREVLVRCIEPVLDEDLLNSRGDRPREA